MKFTQSLSNMQECSSRQNLHHIVPFFGFVMFISFFAININIYLFFLGPYSFRPFLYFVYFYLFFLFLFLTGSILLISHVLPVSPLESLLPFICLYLWLKDKLQNVQCESSKLPASLGVLEECITQWDQTNKVMYVFLVVIMCYSWFSPYPEINNSS